MSEMGVNEQDAIEQLIDWEVRMNRKFPHMQYIRIRNNVDLCEPPWDFTLIDDYVSNCVDLKCEPVLGCECTDCSLSKTCCPFLATPNIIISNYMNGRVNLRPGNAIYECNKRCKCGSDCPNRVVQKGTKVKLEIFRTEDGRGWGLKTVDPIAKGEFVIEYLGEIITKMEADKRYEIYDSDSTYMFDLSYDDAGVSPYVVDAAHYGNASRFINHSCTPNLEAYAVHIDLVDGRLPRLALFALKDIKKDEELTFDYKMCKRKKGRKQFKARDTSNKKKMPCKCGSKNCRKYLN